MYWVFGMPIRASDFSISSMNLKSISKVLESPTGKKRFRFRQSQRKKALINNHCLIESSPSLKFTFLMRKKEKSQKKKKRHGEEVYSPTLRGRTQYAESASVGLNSSAGFSRRRMWEKMYWCKRVMSSSCDELRVKPDFSSSMEMVTSPERVYTGKWGIWKEQ